MKQPGFMIYAEEWSTYAEDFSDEELGRMIRALLSYFNTGACASFSDRRQRASIWMPSAMRSNAGRMPITAIKAPADSRTRHHWILNSG